MNIEEKEAVEKVTLAVRTVTPVSGLPAAIGKAYGDIMAYAQKSGIGIAGPPFVLYYNMDMEALDVEMGFPVLEKATGEGSVKSGKLPGGKLVTALHKGPYSTLEKTCNKLTAYIQEKGIEVEPWMWENYLNSPEEVPEAELLTEVVFACK
jgi:effector-binding domain-containing protein